MEKTIEERAKGSMYKYYQCNGEYTCAWISECEMCDGTNTPYDCCECTAEDYMQGYIQGATDQRKIDIEFVRFWLCDHVVGTTLTAYDIEALTKAMEE